MSAPQDALAQAAACIVELKDQLATVTAERDRLSAEIRGYAQLTLDYRAEAERDRLHLERDAVLKRDTELLEERRLLRAENARLRTALAQAVEILRHWSVYKGSPLLAKFAALTEGEK